LRLEARRIDPRLPKQLKTLGDHIRKRRIELRLFQREVADLVGADPGSVNAWELNYHEPSLHLLPAITEFLGYDPNVVPDQAPLGRRIAARRRSVGLSQRELADCLGIDEGTLSRWERANLQRVSRRVQGLFMRWLSRQR